MSAREKRDCRHPRANHQHGTALAYAKDGCRCTPCTAAHRRHSKATAYRTVSGTHSYVPADRAREHVRQLLEVLTVGQIEQRSGVHRTAIRVLVGDFPGRLASKRITRTTEAALLAVQPDRVGTEQQGLVDGTGTRRRFRALVAMGWPIRELQRRLGLGQVAGQQVAKASLPENHPVEVATRDAVRRLYDELSLTLPEPSRWVTRARNLAAERSWPSPLAWDDDSIDDPDAVPQLELGMVDDHDDHDDHDEHAVELVLDGQPMTLSGHDLEVAALRLVDRGLDYAGIAARCRSDETTVRRVLNTARQRLARAAAREDAA